MWVARLQRDRSEIIPWLDSIVPLRGAQVLEIGCGRGASTFALTEQGAYVASVDVNVQAMDYAKRQLAAADLEATFTVLNAAELDRIDEGPFDLVIFWASLEHMTVAERLLALRNAWDHLAPGAVLAIVETPNRLWPHDSHTSELAFFNWLPDDVAFSYLRNSRRAGLGTAFTDPIAQMLEFQRLGRGVSFHEFELALGELGAPVSCMQLDRRRRNPLRRLAWACSHPGSVERVLRRFAPAQDRAWFQPFLYLALRREPA